MGPAAFSAFMSKIFRPLILSKNVIKYLDDFFYTVTNKTMFKVYLNTNKFYCKKTYKQLKISNIFPDSCKNLWDYYRRNELF